MGQTWSDIVDVVIASRIVVVVIIITPLSSPEERRAETWWERGRWRCVDAEPAPLVFGSVQDSFAIVAVSKIGLGWCCKGGLGMALRVAVLCQSVAASIKLLY